MSELCPSGRSEGYEARDDEGPHAAQDAETVLHIVLLSWLGLLSEGIFRRCGGELLCLQRQSNQSAV